MPGDGPCTGGGTVTDLQAGGPSPRSRPAAWLIRRHPRSYGGWRMSQDEELSAVREDAGAQPSFDQALRGYDKRQVDRYVARMDGELASLAADRDRAFGQARGMAA